MLLVTKAAIFSILLVNSSLALSTAAPVMPLSHGDHSILFTRLADGKVLYASNEDQLLTPASVTKIVTSAALLHYFDATHTFKTNFYVEGSGRGPEIKSSLYVKGDGDPFLVNEKLWQLAADLKHMGIKSFTGDLVIDNSLFDMEKRDRSRSSGTSASEHAYDAPVSAFGVNFNTLPITIYPGSQKGSAAFVGIDPYRIQRLEIKNQTNTEEGLRANLQAVRVGHGPNAYLKVSGEIGQEKGLVKIYRAMGDPVYEGAETMRSFLEEAGIKIKGQIREAVTPKSARLLYSIESYDLGFIVRGLNHHSNNYIADVLVKRLGAAVPQSGRADQPGSGTLANGVSAIQRFLKDEVGITGPFEIFNGSGLDQRNKFSASQLVTLLQYMAANLEVYPEFLASLPAAGLSGTLEKRFRGKSQSELKGIVRAKTGTLSEPYAVASLAGYLGHPKHGLVAFVILNSGNKRSQSISVGEYRKLQDQALLNFLRTY